MVNEGVDIEQIPYVSALSRVSEGIAFVSSAGQILWSNAVFDNLSPDNRGRIDRLLAQLPAIDQKALLLEGYNLSVVPTSQGYLMMVYPLSPRVSATEIILNKLILALREADNLYEAAAKAIAQCMGWRWVAITTFDGPQDMQLEAMWDGGGRLPTYTYNIVGTPCEHVVNSERLTIYSDLTDSFPNYTELQEMGAQTYVGLVYRSANGEAVGHVMAMHDEREVDFGMAQEVIEAAVLALGSHFELSSTSQQLKTVQRQAYQDAMTGVCNRASYESHLKRLTEQPPAQDTNPIIAMIDLDNLKPLNDSLGHGEGDRFIQLMARELSKLGRKQDRTYRIGGDEFAVIFEQGHIAFKPLLLNRFEQAVARVSQTLSFPVSASIGIANFREANRDVDTWTALADKRMYGDKVSKRRLRVPYQKKG